MNNLWIHPSLILICGAVLLPLIPKALKKAFLLFVPLAAFAVVLSMLGRPDALHGQFQFLDWTLTFGRVDKLSLVFAVIMSGMACIGTLYGLHVDEDAQHSASWVYVSGSLGAILNLFSAAGVNLTRIESMASPASPGDYVFFLDFLNDGDSARTGSLLDEVRKRAKTMKFLGCYDEATG